MGDIHAAVVKVLEKRREQLAPVKAALAKSEACRTALAAVKAARGETAHLPDAVVRALDELNLEQAEFDVNAACETLKRAVIRLGRDSVTLGVAGRARQGKSTLLQHLTGLGEEALPTSSASFCTAARSEIVNAPPGSPTRAVIHFHDPASFMATVVAPYYETLALGAAPYDLSEFLALDQIPPRPAGETYTETQETLYSNLKGIKESLTVPLEPGDPAGRKVHQLMNGQPMEIALADLRSYVTNHAGPRKSLAVRMATVHAAFPHEDMPESLRVIDLPGLGELAPSIARDMVASVSEQADIVLMVRRPEGLGDDWKEEDIRTFELMREAIPGVPYSKWLAVVVNTVTGAQHNNEENAAAMVQKAQRFPFREASFWGVDCVDKNAVHTKIVTPTLALLREHVGALDKRAVDAARSAVARLDASLCKPLENVRKALATAEKRQGRDHAAAADVKAFVASLRRGLKQMLSTMRKEVDKRETAKAQEPGPLCIAMTKLSTDFGRALRQNERPADYFPWPVERLVLEFNYYQGYEVPLVLATTNARVALSTYIAAHVEPTISDTVNRLKRDAAARLMDNEMLPKLLSVLRVEGRDEALFGAMAERLSGDDAPSLKAAFRRMADFTFSADDKLLPFIRRSLYVLDPDDGTGAYKSDKGMGSWVPEVDVKDEPDTAAGHLRDALDETAAQVLHSLRDLGEADRQWDRIVFSVLEDFVDQVAWRDEAEAEWDVLVRDHRDQFNADANDDRRKAEQALRAWKRRVDDLENALPAWGTAGA